MADPTFQNGMTPGGTDKNSLLLLCFWAEFGVGNFGNCVFYFEPEKSSKEWIGNSWFGFGNHCICFGNCFNYRCTDRLVSDNGDTAVN